MKTFEDLQSRLADVLALNTPGSLREHVVVAMPSYSVGGSLLEHYGPRIAALEHRYLVVMAMLQRVPGCRLVFVGSQDPGTQVVDYYLSLLPAAVRADVRSRFSLVTVDEPTRRSVAEKLLDRASSLAAVRSLIGDLPAVIEPWNVTEHEVEVACALQVPVNGTDPRLRPLAFKSAGRRLFRALGVPCPVGVEDVRTVDDVVEAAAWIRVARPGCRAVVVKHDDSNAGDGNVVLPLDEQLPSRARALPAWYLQDLTAGGVVEERIEGREFASPSAQIDLCPDGRVVLLATHEQVLGGADGQVYAGCRFPAAPAYAAEIGRHAVTVGEELARRGAVGRASVDFAAARGADGWDVFALEVNLRKGGTSHPYAVLRNNVPGRYDAEAGCWMTASGGSRAYESTDNVLDPQWCGLPPRTVLQALTERGLDFDPVTGTGVVVHMLSCLAVDGRFGFTAVGRDPGHAAQLAEATRTAVREAARRVPALRRSADGSG